MSNQWAELHRRPDLPLHAGATDIVNNIPVKVSASGAWQVLPCVSSADAPLGISRASAPAKLAVAVRDRGEIVRAIAAVTIVAGEPIGVASVNLVTGASGNVQVPQYAPVAKATGSTVWAIGRALESVSTGGYFAFIVDPWQLSNLS